MHLGGAISSYTLKSHVQDPPASEEQLLQDPQCLPILETLQTVQLLYRKVMTLAMVPSQNGAG